MSFFLKTSLFLITSILAAILIPYFLTSQVSAQSTSCVITKVGNPEIPSPTFPAECQTAASADCSGGIGAECAFKFIVAYTSRCGNWGDSRAGGTRSHMGVDLCAPENTPIRALESGVVVESYDDAGCGNLVKIRDNNQRFSMHCHLIRLGLPKNTPVTQGQVIGNVGRTGSNGGSLFHLHYQINNPGQGQSSGWSNPEVVLQNWPNY